MGGWLKRLRGVMGLGLVGGAAGAVFGGLWWFGSSVLGLGSIVFGTLGWTAALWGGFGAFATTGVGVLLATDGAKSTLEDLSPWRVAAFGAVMGLLAPPVLVFVVTGSFWAPGVGLVGGMSGVFGALLGSGLVLTAKRAQAAELSATQDLDAIGRGG